MDKKGKDKRPGDLSTRFRVEENVGLPPQRGQIPPGGCCLTQRNSSRIRRDLWRRSARGFMALDAQTGLHSPSPGSYSPAHERRQQRRDRRRQREDGGAN